MVSNTCAPPISPGAICTVGVAFTPPSAGVFPGTLTISDNDVFGSQQVVTLNGTGATGPSLRISPTTFNFGNQAINVASAGQTLTVTNIGDTVVAFPTGAFRTSGDYLVQSSTCGATLALGASCAVNLQFKPAVTYYDGGSLIITSNARGNPQMVPLIGTGTTAGGTASVTLTSSPNPSTPGHAVTLTATVTPPTGTSLVPTGTVAFDDYVTLLGTVALNGNGQAVITSTSLTAGTHTLNAVYSGDSNFPSASSPVLTQIVNASTGTATTTTLTSSANPATTGQSIVLTATVTGAGSNTPIPTGTVTFLDGTATLGTGTLNGSAQATLTTTSLGAGSHSITVVYGADANYAASTSAPLTEVVNPPAKVSTTTLLSSSLNPAASGQSITFTASVTGIGSNTPTPTGTVTFIDGTTTLGTGTLNASGIATFSISTLSQGDHSLTAQYAGDTNYAGSLSAGLSQSITAPIVPTNFSISFNPTSVSVTRGQSASTTITVTSVGGFNQSVGLACSGLPQFATCSFSSSSVTPGGTSTTATSTLTIATNVTTSSIDRIPTNRGGNSRTLSYALVLGIGLFASLRKRRYLTGTTTGSTALILVLGLLAGLVAVNIIGCGGKGASNPTPTQTTSQTPTGTSTITVTGTAGSQVQTGTFTLVVQ